MAHLAELNIARLLYGPEDVRVQPFMKALDFVNGLAERSDGFVWRLKDESGNATSIDAFGDPRMIVNMSVWRDVASLEKFVWQTVHKRFYERRAEWFSIMEKQHLAMWWVEEGAHPDIFDAKTRLKHLQRYGPSDIAFGWADIADAQIWKTARCA